MTRPRIVIIAAVARNGVIGNNNELPWQYPADLKFFSKTTMHSTVIMGRNTYQSIGGPLAHRVNIVISQTLGDAPGCTLVRSLSQALDAVQTDTAFIIGGSHLYEVAETVADEMIITDIPETPVGDALFVPAYWTSKWRPVEKRTLAGGLAVWHFKPAHKCCDYISGHGPLPGMKTSQYLDD